MARLILVGGGARSRAYRQVLADLSGRAVLVPHGEEQVATGACVQAAAVASGVEPADVADRWKLGDGDVIEPGTGSAAAADVRGAYAMVRERVMNAFEPVRWGVLGCASIATRKVIPAMQRSARCDVVAIASRDAELATATAAELGIIRAYGSYDALLADDDVEAVYIPLPNHLHAEWTLRAAAAGKHVLCEKPLAMSAAEAAEMVDGCAAAGVLLMEAFMYRLHPLWQRVRSPRRRARHR